MSLQVYVKDKASLDLLGLLSRKDVTWGSVHRMLHGYGLELKRVSMEATPSAQPARNYTSRPPMYSVARSQEKQTVSRPRKSWGSGTMPATRIAGR
jgi:hypothetical protein